MAKLKGHMKQERQHLHYTKKQPPPQTIKTTQEDKESRDCTLYYFPPFGTPNLKTSGVMCSMIINDEKSQDV